MDLIKTEIYTDKEWSDFLKLDYNLFFDPRFISYNDKLEKKIIWHHLKVKDKHRVVAIINGCEKEINGIKHYISCNGVSFGGFIWNERVKIGDYMETLDTFKDYLKNNGFGSCIIRNPPCIYQKNVNEEYEFALIHEGFETSNISITNIIDLYDFEFEKLANPKKRAIKKSETNIEVNIIDGPFTEGNFRAYYEVLRKNRELKNVTPTHTEIELIFLKNNLPEKIVLFSAFVGKELAGMCILFLVKNDVVLNFYLATEESFKKERVSAFVLFKSIEWAKNNGFRLYDVGTSNIGNEFLDGLFDFKKKFMANGYLRKTYILNNL